MLLILSYLDIFSADIASFGSRTTLFLMSLNTRKRKWILTMFTFNRSFLTIKDMSWHLGNKYGLVTILAWFFGMKLILNR